VLYVSCDVLVSCCQLWLCYDTLDRHTGTMVLSWQALCSLLDR
jgi:hypothetical protein